MSDLLNPPDGQPRIDFWPPFILFGDDDALTLVHSDQWIGRAGKDELEEAPLILACTERIEGVGYVFRVIRSAGERISSFDSLCQLAETVTGASIEYDRLIVDTIDHLIDHLTGTKVKVEAETAPVHAIADDKPVEPLIASDGAKAAAANMMAAITRRAPAAELKGIFLPVKTPPKDGPHSRVDDLFRAAAAVRGNAHAPYSKYKVAAAIMDEDGTIHTGVNVENAAYPQGQCAETSAISAMVTAGERRIAAVLVLGGSPNDGALCTPCGGCRQRIREFAGPDTPVYVCGPEGIRRILTLDDLLPLSFGPDNLTF